MGNSRKLFCNVWLFCFLTKQNPPGKIYFLTGILKSQTLLLSILMKVTKPLSKQSMPPNQVIQLTSVKFVSK